LREFAFHFASAAILKPENVRYCLRHHSALRHPSALLLESNNRAKQLAGVA